jgi:hypothetical protein
MFLEKSSFVSKTGVLGKKKTVGTKRHNTVDFGARIAGEIKKIFLVKKKSYWQDVILKNHFFKAIPPNQIISKNYFFKIMYENES